MPIPQEINLNKEFEGLKMREARKELGTLSLSLCTFLFLHCQHHGLRGKKEDKVAKGFWMCVFITSATAKINKTKHEKKKTKKTTTTTKRTLQFVLFVAAVTEANLSLIHKNMIPCCVYCIHVVVVNCTRTTTTAAAAWEGGGGEGRGMRANKKEEEERS